MFYSRLLSEFPEVLCVFTQKTTAGFYGYDSSFGLPQINPLLNSKGYSCKQSVCAQQVHGSSIKVVGLSNRGQMVPNTDGLYTQAKSLFLVVKTADCVPVVVFDCQKKSIGIAHAGWKGILGNIVPNLLNVFMKHGSRVNDLKVVLGPSIGPCCYDVPLERAQLFWRIYPETVHKDSVGHVFLDLKQFIQKQAINFGVSEKQIEMIPLCTYHRADLFHSRRREMKSTHPVIMNNISFIGIVGSR